MRTFKLHNVIKKTDNPVKIKQYEALGYDEIKDAPKPAAKTEEKPDEKKAEPAKKAAPAKK